MTRRALVLGADGFIGRYIIHHLRDAGWDVLASARRVSRLERMGFAVLQADLADPATHDAAFWAPHLADGRAVVNAAGLLTGSEAAFRGVHVAAPRAAYAARAAGAPALLLSAVGLEADTPFAHWRREGEAVAAEAGATILRAGLVLGDTSYGGSSLARALAALPVVTPVVGDGQQVFNPIHARDLSRVIAACLDTPPPPGPQDIGGPERITQAGLLGLLRGWMGLAPVPVLRIPLPMARTLGRVGDLLRLGPVSLTAVTQLARGVEADETALTRQLGLAPDGVSRFATARPAGTQDLWHARLYLMRPVLRLTLAFLWLFSGLLGLFLPSAQFLPLVEGSPVPDAAWIAMARLGGVADLVLVGLLLRNWRPRLTGIFQLGLVGAYTISFSFIAPELWFLPLGGLQKNLPILALILVWMVLEDER
ncbi:SDR family oxidoreductase [Roseibacterium sp. SDUM158016]|uniref:SDR family oxidoreductase n=1 Tax=Roseicyclus sediminis TaxID=2980997 RepID=UPI0021D0CF11|nr:SDR family oxidoreductase [Roseibacterium sp. SDUM158016]MCU4653955.1 SDR family oxidoreductase [Roseibacterium sp. SDUM158016]